LVFFVILFYTGNSLSLFARINVDSLENVLTNSSGEDRISILNQLSSYYAVSSPDKSISYASDALSLARDLSDREGEAKALRNMGDSYYYMNNLNEAIVYYAKSANKYFEIGGEGSQDYIGRIGDVAYCYDMLNEYAIALKYYQQNIENATTARNKIEIAANLANAGRIYTIWGEYGKAIECMEKALELDGESGYSDVIATDYNTIGKIFSSWGEHEKAIEYFELAL